MATLNLPDGVRVACWRLLKTQLQADATLGAAGPTLVFLDGNAEDTRELSTEGGPAVRFVPALGNQAWFDEGSQYGSLIVFVEAFLPLPDVEDLMNLQEALEGAVNTVANLTLQGDLVTAGAVTGLVLFTQPLNMARGREGQNESVRATGQFVVEVRRPLLS